MIDKQQAQEIIRDTFENSFDKDRFTGFIKNLLNRIDEDSFIYHGKYIPDAYKQYIRTLERIGNPLAIFRLAELDIMVEVFLRWQWVDQPELIHQGAVPPYKTDPGMA